MKQLKPSQNIFDDGYTHMYMYTSRTRAQSLTNYGKELEGGGRGRRDEDGGREDAGRSK